MPKRRDHGSGGLYWDKRKGLWRAVLDLGRDADGKRLQKEVTSKDRKVAAAKLKALVEAVEANGGLLPERPPLLSEWAEWWLEDEKHRVDPKTWANYASITRRWVVPLLGRKTVDQIRPADVTALRQHIVDDNGRGLSLARQARVCLSKMMAAAKANRYCRTNPVEDASKVRSSTVAKRGSFTTEQGQAILRAADALPDWDGSRWWFKLLVGQRQGEILGATLDALDLEAGYYEVGWKLEQVPREHGCGGTCGKRRGADCPQARWRIPDEFEMRHLEGRWCLTRPKSRTGRGVPLVTQVAERIRACIVAHADEPNPHGLVWHNPDGSPIDPKADADQWRALLLAAGIITDEQNVAGGTPLTGHWARHTTVTVLAELGVDFQLIGEMVGHSAAQVTAMYRHARDDEKRRAMEGVAGKLAIDG